MKLSKKILIVLVIVFNVSVYSQSYYPWENENYSESGKKNKYDKSIVQIRDEFNNLNNPLLRKELLQNVISERRSSSNLIQKNDLTNLNNTIPEDFIILPDTRVNELDGIKGRHTTPEIAKQPDGKYVVVWVDERNTHADIYAQRFEADGSPIGNNFKVNDDVGSAWQLGPAIATDSSGNFTITWEDRRNGSKIYAQSYDANGNAAGNNFIVAEGNNEFWLPNPSIEKGKDGSFVIAWNNLLGTQYSILAQRFDSDGNKIGEKFRVDDDPNLKSKWGVSVGVDRSDNFVITWMDDRNGNFDFEIYAQRYSSDGTALGNNFLVSTNAGNDGNIFPEIAMDNNEGFIISWAGRIDGFYDIYAQRFDKNGNPVGSNFKVNDNTVKSDQLYPDIGVDSVDSYVISWKDSRAGNDDVYVQKYDSTDKKIGANVKVNDDTESARQLNDAIAVDRDGSFVVVWGDVRKINSDIYSQAFSSDVSAVGSNKMVNENSGSANRYNSYTSVRKNGDFLITWTDERNGGTDVYAQLLSTSGNKITNNILINDDQNKARQNETSSVIAADGSFIVVWEDNRNDDGDIYGQRFNLNGEKVGANFLVNDDGTTLYQGAPAIGIKEDGSFIVAWSDSRNGNGMEVFAQMYDSEGNKVGSNYLVSNTGVVGDAWSVAVEVIKGGSYIITWKQLSWANFNLDIYSQRFNSDNTTKGDNFKVNDGKEIDWMSMWNPLGMDVDSSGNFVVVWEDNRNGKMDIWAQQYNSEGSTIDSNFQVNDPDTLEQSSPSVGVDFNGNFIISWTDFRDSEFDPNCYAQKFSPEGGKIGGNYVIHNSNETFIQRISSIVLSNGKIYSSWEDARETGNGISIYTNIHTFSELKLLSPNGGESLEAGKMASINWVSTNSVDQINIELSTDNGSTWENQTIQSSVSGTFEWIIPNISSENCFIRISDAEFPTIFDISDGKFSITQVTVAEVEDNIPNAYNLYGNYPNPFNPSTTISFALPLVSKVKLKIINILGQTISELSNNKIYSAGYHSIIWNASSFSSGVYLILFTAESFDVEKEFNMVRKMVLAK